MRRLLTVVFAFASLSLSGAAAQQKTLTLTGTVADNRSRLPISGARVSVAGDQALSSTVTDSNGTFELTLSRGVSAGDKVRIRVEKIGYEPYDSFQTVPSSPLAIPILISAKGQGPAANGESTPPSARTRPATPILTGKIAASADLRGRGLALADDITEFLKERKTRGIEPSPGFSASGGDMRMDSQTPPYMKETRALFIEKFEARVADIHDELYGRALHDMSLDAVYKNFATTVGDVDEVIETTAQSIRDLSLLVPPDGLYRDVSDSQLAKMAIDEAYVMDEKTAGAMNELRSASDDRPPDAVRFFFSRDFVQCCLNEVEFLRAEILKRLGPSAFNSEEMLAYNGPLGLTQIESQPSSSISAVSTYYPFLREMATKLKHSVAPLPEPLSLDFSMTAMGADELIVTVRVRREITSGYIAVQWQGYPREISNDLIGSQMVFNPREIYDDPDLANLLEQNGTTQLYVLKVGRVPLSVERSLHILVSTTQGFQVVRVMYFEE